MKYNIQKKGTKFCIYDDKGNKEGEFDTRREAIKVLQKLIAAPDETDTKVEKKVPGKKGEY